MELTRAIKTRRSAKRFSNKKPNWRDIIECIDSARYAPMAGNNYSLKFILVNDEKKIREIADASEQDFVSRAQFIVVAFSTQSRTTNSYGERGKVYLRQQAGAAIQNFLLKINEKKLSTCWIGHFNEDKIKHILKIPEEMQIEALFPIGFESSKQKMSRKIDLDRILYFEEYGQKRMRKENKVNV
ncbi:MAG: nitroreductase family protein [Nanoarchaeota archaeon]|nr:nitroreductase family protein [Nanoarchaeota archaeon]